MRSTTKPDLLSQTDIANNIEIFLDALGLDYLRTETSITMGCPIHGSRRNNSLNIYTDTGIWRCWSDNCNSVFGSHLFGFIRGCLSVQKSGWSSPGDPTVPASHTRNFIRNLANVGVDKKKEYDYFKSRNKKATNGRISREAVRKSLKIPSEYYIGRGFSEEILNRYDVGECCTKGKKMYGRAVIPIYDENKNMIGSSGRAIYDWEPKWLHIGFEKSQNIFNYWEAAPHIKQSMTAIITESPNNVMKFEQAGIHNSLAIFGNNITDPQLFMLERLGVMKLRIALDNDDAGCAGTERIKRLCKDMYNLEFASFLTNDVAELNNEQIKSIEWN